MYANKQTIKNNKNIIANVLAAFLIKGTGMIVSFLAMPLYMNYFQDNKILGVWFAILTIVNWILSFDVGIGNGLRNNLTIALAHKNYNLGKSLVSSACALMGLITLITVIIVFCVVFQIDWNGMINVSETLISKKTMSYCISVTLIGVLMSFFLSIVKSLLYALQLASINNLIQLMTNALLVLYLFAVPFNNNIEYRLKLISFSYAIIINVPLLLAAIYVFLATEVKYCLPSIRTISKKAINAVLGLGISFFIVQILYMIITVTNEWFISKFFSPENCVDYQIYFRLFSLPGTMFMLAMTPLWSAITKAYAEKRYQWIIKLQKVLYGLAFGCILIECFLLPLLQPAINFWLKGNTITVNYQTALYFLLYGIISIWIAIQSTVVAGLGKIKQQLWLYSFAVLFKVFFIIIASRFTQDWSIVVLATALGLIPYCIIQPIYIKKTLKSLAVNNV